MNNRDAIVVAYTWCDGRATDSGLVGTHSYTVVSADAARGTVTVRNPWGSDGRNGAIQGANDGVFTISWATFVRNYAGYSIGLYS